MAVLFMAGWARADQRVLKVGVDCCIPPFAFIDGDSNVIRGFNIDLARLLAGNMGARIKFYPVPAGNVKKSLSEGSIDFALTQRLSDGALQALDLPVLLERKFFVPKNCLTITCLKDLQHAHKVVILAGSGVETLIPQDRGVVLLPASSHEEALRKLDSGEADAFLSPSAVSTNYHVQKLHLSNVKEVGLPVETLPVAITVLRTNTTLLTELSVAYGKITENKNYQTIQAKWFGQSSLPVTFGRYLKVILGALIIFALALLATFMWNRTLRKRVQKVTTDLKQSEQKYRDLIESSPEMVHLISPEGGIVLSNKIALLRLGYDGNQPLSLVDLADSESSGAVGEFIAAVFSEGHGTKEFAFRSRDGKRIEVEITATTLASPEATTMLACCFSRDVSERKRLEEELMQSERLAIMGQMTAGIAHEINNPLGIILANTEELLPESAGEARENLEAIERNALRAGRFIEDLLTFTRPTPTRKARLDLVEAVEESLLLCKQQMKQKGIGVVREVPEEPVWFEGDGNQIQQLVVNLLLNSIQAIESKGSIRIALKESRDNGIESVILEVADTGSGIPEKDLSRIFDLFYTARKNKGFGLGLFISKRIVEKHSGTIHAASEVGRGTVIRVEFPRNRDLLPAGQDQMEAAVV